MRVSTVDGITYKLKYDCKYEAVLYSKEGRFCIICTMMSENDNKSFYYFIQRADRFIKEVNNGERT